MNAKNPLHRRGFSLIEVLIALVVLATGMLAIASLQTALTRSSGLTKSRGIAISVATGELERIRAESIRDKDFYDGLATQAATEVDFADDLDIDEDAASGLFGENFTIGRRVTRMQRFRSAADCGAQPVPCYKEIAAGDSDPSVPEFKRVVVSVGWTDAVGQAQSVQLTDIVPSVFNAGSLSNIENPFGSAAVSGPVVKINVPTDPGVIPIAVADGSEESAASNPKPIIYDRGSTDQTRFEILTYSPDGSTATLNRRIDVAVVGCRCTTEDPDPTGEKDFFDTVRTPTYWDGYRYVTPELNDDSTPRGFSASAGEKGKDVSQDPELCQTCCQDHHDYAENDVQLDPWRALDSEADSDFTSGAHNHYAVSLDNSGNVGWTLQGKDSTDYNEVCRMIRVDGFWSVAPDPLLLQMSLLETDIASSRSQKTAIPKTGTDDAPGPVERYQSFLKEVLADRFLASSAVRADLNTHDPLAAGNGIEPNYSDVLLQPATLDLGVEDDFWYLHDRGIFVDYLDTTAVDVLKQELADCKARTPDRDTFDCILPFLPIVSINTTDLAQWKSQNQSYISVSNLSRNSTSVSFDGEECAKNDKDCTTPGNRGLVDGKSEGSESSIVSMFRSSSALADVYPIDPHDGAATVSGQYDYAEEMRSDQQAFVVGSGGGETGGDGKLVLPKDGSDTAVVTSVGDSPRDNSAVLSFKLEFVTPLPKPTPDWSDLSFVAISPSGVEYTITPSPALSGTNVTGVSFTLSGLSDDDRDKDGWTLEVTNNGGKEVTVLVTELMLSFKKAATTFQVVATSASSTFGFTAMTAVPSSGGTCEGATTTPTSRTFNCKLDSTITDLSNITVTLSYFNTVGSVSIKDGCNKNNNANVCRNFVPTSVTPIATGGTNGRLNESATFKLDGLAQGSVHTITFGEDSPFTVQRGIPKISTSGQCKVHVCTCDGNIATNVNDPLYCGGY